MYRNARSSRFLRSRLLHSSFRLQRQRRAHRGRSRAAASLPIAARRRRSAPRCGATRKAAKFSTSSSSFKRIARLTICFMAFPARRRDVRLQHFRSKNRLKPVGLEDDLGRRARFVGFRGGVQRHGQHSGTDCQMNGFDKDGGCGHHWHDCPNSNPPYSYVPHDETKPYFDMGKQYVLADQMYASNFDASSYISHQYIIAAQAEASVNFPYGAWGCPGGSGDSSRSSVRTDKFLTATSNRVIPTRRSAKKRIMRRRASPGPITRYSYAGYPGIWSAYQANQYVYYGSDWDKDIKSPPSSFLSDVSNGKLRQISWVTPTCKNSDHAGCGSNTGPAWVASLVNAIGQSKYWNNTAIFIFWDDYGGWYDPEPPAYADYDGLGMRIPMVDRIGLCAQRSRFARPLRDTAASSSSSRTRSAWGGFGQRHARHVAGERLLRLQNRRVRSR